MKLHAMMLGAALAVGACSPGNESDQQDAAGNSGAMINRADDAPGNMTSAPVPVSGSGEVPPNAQVNESGGNDAANANAAP